MGVFLLSCGVVAQAQELSQADKDRALQYLESTERKVIDSTKGLTPEQWNFKPAPDRWSVAECVEHIAAAEDYLRGMVVEKVMTSPAAPDRDVKAADDNTVTMVTDRSHKAKAPEALVPTNRFGSPEAALKHFEESRAKTVEFLKNTPDLRAHATDGPGGVKLDAYQWILFIAAHSERHDKQIEEVKADLKFPKA
jgi:uncharacterized damage-inducible protein DinB